MEVLNASLKLIHQVRKKNTFKGLYWVVKVSMGLTFMGSGVRKLPGIRFTALAVDNPVGNFFEAMFQTGFYWNTIGVVQIILGLLMFFNRTVVASSLLMMPVTINIFLVSVALQMQGTPFITSAMLVANIFLLLWHYENYLPIVQRPKYRQYEPTE